MKRSSDAASALDVVVDGDGPHVRGSGGGSDAAVTRALDVAAAAAAAATTVAAVNALGSDVQMGAHDAMNVEDTVAVAAPPPAKKRRTTQPIGNLTNAQKRMLCVKFAQVKMTQQELCVWAKDEFKLAHLPHQSTISKILARSSELTSMPTKDLSSRRKGLVTHPELDTALCNWVLFARQSNVKLSGDMIKDKARQLAATFGLESKMTFSNGWLGGFKKRHNIRLGSTTAATTAASSVTSTSSSAAGIAMPNAVLDAATGAPSLMSSLGSPDAAISAFNADPAVAFAQMSAAAAAAAAAGVTTPVPLAVRELQDCIKLYHPSDVFALSETGLYYALSPEKPASRGARAVATAAAKRERERLTVALAANADGSEKLEPFFIGSTKLPPKALQSGLDGEELVTLRYRDNKKAWVTPVIFQEWIGLLDSKLRDDARSILLLIAHAPAHIRIGLELTNIRLEMLPPSTTRQFQPFEAGIFDAFKRRYRRHALHHALDRFEAGLHDDVFQIDIVQAMRWARECWFALPPSTLKHYWDATELGGGGGAASAQVAKAPSQLHHAVDDAEAAIESEICDAVSALQIARPMTIDEFVSPSDESLALHCTGTDESDFIFSVSENPEREFAAAKLANELKLAESAGGGDSGSGGSGNMMVPGSAPLSGSAFGSRTTNEQLLESLKVLLPELDRLRFDEHTKNSIRLAFRRLKDKEVEQSADGKQRQAAVRRAMQSGGTGNSSSSGQVGASASFAAALAHAAAVSAVVETADLEPAEFDASQAHAAGAADGAVAVATGDLVVPVQDVEEHTVI